MQRSHEMEKNSRVDGARWLLSSLASPTYDETANGMAGLLTLGVDWLKRHQLAALAWIRLQRAYSLPLEFRQDLRRAYYLAVGDCEVHDRELSRVLERLNSIGLKVVVFKGVALARLAYPDLAARPMGDIDIWVAPYEMSKAQEALKLAGYVCAAKPERPFEMMAQYHGELAMVGADRQSGLVELHWSVFLGEWLRRAACVGEANVWARVVPLQFKESVDPIVWTLAGEDALIQLCTHCAINHQVSFFALRSLMDVVLLARHQPLDWEAVIQRAREWRVATATWLVLALAQDLCGLDEAAAAVQALAPSRVRQKLIGLFANPHALVEMRDLSKSRWRYVYLLLMVDRKRDAVKLVYRALWPEGEWLQARYGRTGWRVRLQHLVDAARGKI